MSHPLIRDMDGPITVRKVVNNRTCKQMDVFDKKNRILPFEVLVEAPSSSYLRRYKHAGN